MKERNSEMLPIATLSPRLNMSEKLNPKRYENYETVLSNHSEAFKAAYRLVFPNLIAGANWALVRVRGPLAPERRKALLEMNQERNIEVLQVKNGFVITINREIAYNMANAITGGFFNSNVMSKLGHRHLNELGLLETCLMDDSLLRGDYEVGIYNTPEPGIAGMNFFQGQSKRFAVTVRDLNPRLGSDHIIKIPEGHILVSDLKGKDDLRRFFLQQCRITLNSTGLMCPISHKLDERRRRNG